MSDPAVPNEHLAGGCLCGAIRYKVDGEPKSTVLCHCTHCQRVSGSAFSVNLFATPDQISLDGDPARFDDRGESGSPVERFFCPRCGSSLYSRLSTGLIAIKAGTLDKTAGIRPTGQFWQRSAQSWIGELNPLPGHATVPAKT